MSSFSHSPRQFKPEDYHDLPLLPHHAQMLADSAISPEVAKQRGYRSLTKKSEAKKLGFNDTQSCVPALALPIYNVTGEVVLHQIRPDTPRANSEAKPIKYDTPHKARMALDVPPAVRNQLANPNRPLFITEGVKKADSAVSHGLTCVALLGVWSWRGTREEHAKLVLPDWDLIHLENREVYIVFDSDVMLKSQVHKALVRLKGVLELRKAIVKVIYLDPRTDGTKVGLDDFFANCGVIRTLLANATDQLRDPPKEDRPYPYEETTYGLLYHKPTKDGAISIPLCNFTARIVSEIKEDDGAEVASVYEIEAKHPERTMHGTVSAEQFESMNWVAKLLGRRGIIIPGSNTRDHIKVAIKLFSSDATDRTVFKHTGWREWGSDWVYLHADGAIGANGVVSGIDVRLPSGLEMFRLPPPPCGEALHTATRASLGILQVMPPRIAHPVFSAIWRAILGDVDSSIFIYGPTGQGKSELAALAQQHSGSGMSRLFLPGNFMSTENSIEYQAFLVKDEIFVIDDFCPTGALSDIQRAQRVIDRVFRSQGNRSGRGRMNADLSLRAPKPPRGLMIGTGEELARNESLRARQLTLRVSNGDMDWKLLKDCQRDAAEGLYAQAKAAYLQWLAPQYERIKKNLPSEIFALREKAAQESHKRTPEVVANLAVGLRYFLRFAQETGTLSQEEAKNHWEQGWQALGKAAEAHALVLGERNPARRFLELIIAGVASGEAHLATLKGEAPEKPRPWGWRHYNVGTGDYMRGEWRAHGKRIGWIDTPHLYLNPEAAFELAQTIATRQGDVIPVSQKTLAARLKEEGLLSSWDDKRQRTTIRRVAEGRELAVLHLDEKVFTTDSLSSADSPSRPSSSPSFDQEREDPNDFTEQSNGQPSSSGQDRPSEENDRPVDSEEKSSSDRSTGRSGQSFNGGESCETKKNTCAPSTGRSAVQLEPSTVQDHPVDPDAVEFEEEE